MGYSETEAELLLRDLDGKTMKDLDELFENGETPRFEDCQEETRAELLLWDRKNASRFVRVMVKLLFESPLGRWTGKEFIREFTADKEGTGINLFRNRILPRRFRFDTYIKSAYSDGENCLALDYGNYRSIMSGLVDDVRKIDDGMLLGQMHYKSPLSSEKRFMGYFALCPLEDSNER